jgi:hypothetical protein
VHDLHIGVRMLGGEFTAGIDQLEQLAPALAHAGLA